MTSHVDKHDKGKAGFLARFKGKIGIRLDDNLNDTKPVERKRRNLWKLETKWEAGSWSGVALSEAEILVVSGKAMQHYAINGKKKKEIKCEGLKWAWDVEVVEGEVYVSDWIQRAVLVFNRDGTLLRKLCLPERENGLDGALSLAVDKINKDIFVSSEKTNTVYKYERKSRQFIPWISNGLDGPRYLCVAPANHLIVSNYKSNRIIKYDPQGKQVWQYGSDEEQLSGPHGVHTDPMGHILIADSNNNRIVIVSEDGHDFSYINTGKEIVRPKAISFGKDRLVVTTFDSHIYVIKQNKS